MTFTIKQVCERYGVGQATCLTWIRRGELRALNVARSPAAKRPTWRITEEALQDFELIRNHAPPPPTRRRRRKQEGILEFY